MTRRSERKGGVGRSGWETARGGAGNGERERGQMRQRGGAVKWCFVGIITPRLYKSRESIGAFEMSVRPATGQQTATPVAGTAARLETVLRIGKACAPSSTARFYGRRRDDDGSDDDGSDDENRRKRPWYGQVQTLEEPDVEGPGLITAPDNTQYLVVKDATGKSVSIPVSLAKQIPYFGEMLEDGGLSIDSPFLLPNGMLMNDFGHAVNYLSNPERAVEMYEMVADRAADMPRLLYYMQIADRLNLDRMMDAVGTVIATKFLVGKRPSQWQQAFFPPGSDAYDKLTAEEKSQIRNEREEFDQLQSDPEKAIPV